MIERKSLMFLLLLLTENAFAYKPMQILFDGKILDIKTYEKHRIIQSMSTNYKLMI